MIDEENIDCLYLLFFPYAEMWEMYRYSVLNLATSWSAAKVGRV